MGRHHLRRLAWIALPLLLSAALSCSMVQTAAQAAGQASGISQLVSNEGSRQGALEMILSGLLVGVRELLQPQREFWLGLAATLDALSLTDAALTYGIPSAMIQLCATPAPDDLPEPGQESFAVVIDAEEGERAVFGLSGELGEAALPIAVEIETTEAGSTVRVRGGGWLLCGLSEGEIELDGEPLELGDPEVLAADLDVTAWPEPTEESPGPPTSAEVILTLTLTHEVLLPILAAEEVTLWLGDEPVELFTEDSAAVLALRAYLLRLTGAAPEPVEAETIVIEPETASSDGEEPEAESPDDGEPEVEEPATADTVPAP